MDREFDLVVYGATGFTGKEVCRYRFWLSLILFLTMS